MLVYDYHIKKGGTLVGRHWYMNIHKKISVVLTKSLTKDERSARVVFFQFFELM